MKKLLFKKLGLVVMGISLFLAIYFAAFAGKSITLKGSDTLLILGQRWAEIYMNQNPGAIIQVTGGGSGVGIAALINGSTDICQASRPMKSSEIDKLKERFNTTGVEIPVARDGLSIYLSEENKISELTLDQLKGIYIGKITNWKDLGGEDAKIVLYGRENSSGTYSYFKDNVLKGLDFAAQTQTLPGTAAIVNAVSKDKYGIGYGGAAYAKGVKYCKVKKDATTPGYEPTLENIQNGKYPISRYLYWYVRNKPTGEIKKFVDFALSPQGQEIVTKVGYFPVK